MAARELVVLGTASQAPTRRRNHNGYFLRFDAEGILFDPGEGTQRQMTFAGVPASALTRICITHFHGDHCLGLPGVLQRMSLDRVGHPVALYYPAAGQAYVDRLRRASAFEETVTVVEHPTEGGGLVDRGPTFAMRAAPLAHRVETIGWRVDEPDGRTMLPARLAALGIEGPATGELQRAGTLVVDGRRVTVEEVSVPRRGQSVAFVMDTGPCDGALALADGVDLLVCEATFSSADAALARSYGHLTAAEAAAIAREARARRLLITHFSARYPDVGVLLDEARAVFPDTVAAEDLSTVALPARRTVDAGGR